MGRMESRIGLLRRFPYWDSIEGEIELPGGILGIISTQENRGEFRIIGRVVHILLAPKRGA